MKTYFIVCAKNGVGGIEDGLEITREARGFFHEGKKVPVIPGLFLPVERHATGNSTLSRVVEISVSLERFEEIKGRLKEYGWTPARFGAGW